MKRMMKKNGFGFYTGIFTAIALSIAPLCYANSEEKAASLNITKYIQGGPVEIEEGKITVVEFWATWCPPCRTSIPHINKLYNKYKDTGVAFVGISNENENVIKEFVEKMGSQMQYPVGMSNADLYRNYMGKYNINGIPHAFIIDENGSVAWNGHPMEMEKPLKQIIAKRANTKSDTDKEVF